MDENQDFVIDTGMPVVPPAQEETAETVTEETPVADENVPVHEELAPSEKSEESTGKSVVAELELEPETTNVFVESETPAEPKVPVDVDTVPIAEPATLNLDDIAALIERLERKFDEKIAVDAHKNDLFDKLYKERDEYKNDFYGKLLKPFITGAIQIITDLRMYISKMDTFEVERSLNYLKSLPDDIIELLENNGVELFTEEGDTFNPRTQRAKKLVETNDMSLNNKIAERMEEGFRWNGVVLRPEYVAVYKTNN